MTEGCKQTPYVQYADRALLPATSGIYVVRQDETVLYVGQTGNFHKRWLKHHRGDDIDPTLGDTRIYYIEMPLADAKRLEDDYVEALNPTLNKRRPVKFTVRIAQPDNPRYESADAALAANVGLLVQLIRAGQAIELQAQHTTDDDSVLVNPAVKHA